MLYEEFIDQTIKMIKMCECNEYGKDITGFKLKIEKNNIKSITVTTQVLLIFEQLFGHNFMFNPQIRREFNFNHIKKYLLLKKEEFIATKPEYYSNINVSRCAYCGIGLLLLKEDEAANEIADFLCNNMIKNEFAWGLRLTDESPDILPTYIVTMLLNRLHREFQRPSFINGLIENCDNAGIPFNENIKQYRYVEALTIVLYMDKYYYCRALDERMVKIVNDYYYNGRDAICESKETYFKEHPCNQWRLYGFGLAANIVNDMNDPFYEFTLEKLTKYFDKSLTNVPYVLELCRMYNAIKRANDPFKQNRTLHSVLLLKEKVENVELTVSNKIEELEKEIKIMREYDREITIKIPIATAFVALYFVGVGVFIFFFLKEIAIRVFCVQEFNDVYIIIDLIISVVLPVIGFIFKKTREWLIKLVHKFYETFNTVRRG